MTEAQLAPNLQQLEDRYDIVGELRMGERSRMYLARRREDGEDVVISVVRALQGDENNALNHYAADAQLLSRLEHPQIPRIIESRWISKAELAVVSERRVGNTLGEVLARGERFSPPRIASILAEVARVLDWARSNGVVHRGVTVDTLAFDQASNETVVSLALTPIPMQGIPDAGDDARTIGLLAWTMLTGAPRTDDRSLGELRPDLAKRVIDETDAMVRSTSGDTRDVPTFLAVLAAADALRAGEMEIAEMEASILEARRTELAAFEAEQRAAAERYAELQEQLAGERREFERRMAEEEAALASLREQFDALKAHEESQIMAERAQLDQERSDFDARVTQLDAREAEIERKLAEVARLRAEEGKRIDAAIAAAVETVAATATVAPPPVDGEGEEWKGPDARPGREPWMVETVRQYSVGEGEGPGTDTTPRRRPRWLAPSLITAAVLVLAALGVRIQQHRQPSGDVVSVGGAKVVPTPPPTDVRGIPRGGFLTQSAGGTVATPVGPPLAPTNVQTAPAPMDSVLGGSSTGAAGAAGTTVPPGAAVEGVQGGTGARPATTPGATTPVATTPRKAAESPRPRAAFSAEADAIARADSIRRDSLARRPDTTARGTLVRPDTLR